MATAEQQLPPAMKYEDDFTPDLEMMEKVSQHLDVHPEWAKQGIYYSSDSSCFDEICAWVLENHPRFVVVSSSSDAEDADDPERPALYFIVNESALHNVEDTCEVADNVAQAMLEFYRKFQSHESIKAWIDAGSPKAFLKVKDAEKLYNLNAEAEADDLLSLYVNRRESSPVNIGPAIVLAVFGPQAKNLVQSLPKLK